MIKFWNFLEFNLAIEPILLLKYRPHQTGSDQRNIFNSNCHIFCTLTFHLVRINTFITIKNAQVVFIRDVSTKVAYQTIIKPDWLKDEPIKLIDYHSYCVQPEIEKSSKKRNQEYFPKCTHFFKFSLEKLIKSFTKCTWDLYVWVI